MCTPPTNKDTTIIQLAYWQLRIMSLTFRLNIKDARDNCDLFFVSARRGKYKRMKKVSMFAFFLARKRKSKRRNFHYSSCALLNVIIGKQPQNATPFWKKNHSKCTPRLSLMHQLVHVWACTQFLSCTVQLTLAEILLQTMLHTILCCVSGLYKI